MGTDFTAYPSNSSHFRCYARDAQKIAQNLMRENQIPHFDLLVSQDPFFCAHVALSLKKVFAKISPCPLQIQDHSCFLSSPEFRQEKFFRPALVCWGKHHLRKADHIRVVNGLEKKMIEAIIAKKIPIDVQPVPVDTEIFQQSLSIEKNTEMGKKILWVGRFSSEKNLPLILKAFQHLKKTHPKTTLILAGPTREEITAIKGELNGITVWGKVDYADLPRLYRSVDVLVSTSRYEGYGRIFIEALFCDLPIMATPTAGFLEAVPPDLQIQFPPDEISLANCLRYFIENHDKKNFLKKVTLFKAHFKKYDAAVTDITQTWQKLMGKK
jgi:glycosyltransferase involved in cell wall biosynthesis